MAHGLWREAEKDLLVAEQDALRPREYQRELPRLLRRLMALTAMKFGRAPLPIPWTLLKRYVYRDWPGNLSALDTFVTRYLFLGDARLALRGGRIRAQMSPAVGPARKFGPDAGKRLESRFQALAPGA